MYLASQNSMAALIEGLTFHSFCSVPFQKSDGGMANTRGQQSDQHGMSNLFLRYERLRWIFIDEFPTMGCEVLSRGDDNLRNSIREENTWAMRSAEEKRPWGGVNLGCFGDFWQYRPVKLTAVFDNPLKTYKLSSTERILEMFWTRGPDSVQEFFELTKENRCQDEWLSYLLRRARHGDMEHELYCFMHGLPTKHTGSWMPHSGKVLCRSAACEALPATWGKELLSGSPRSWAERCKDECLLCQQERRRRCRVLLNMEDHETLDVKFADAPLIHPWNAPKYHAALVRAREYARRTARLLLWAVAEDTPMSAEHRNLDDAELDAKRREWAMYHDQKTAGVMGLLPCVWNMPLRITVTDPGNKTVLFKHRRCRLHGWRLHQNDLSRLEGCSTPEMKLEYLPEELFVKIPKATWIWSPELGPGVIGLKPTTVTWYLDRLCQIGIQRRGFTVAADFSGTGHSFAGESLPAAFLDCLPWDARPDKPGQIAAYMGISRVRHIDDIYITQPYAPTLFSQGDLPGPELLLKFQRRDIDTADLRTAWKGKEDTNSRTKTKWPASMDLLCRGCSEQVGEDVYKPLSHFRFSSDDSIWDEVIAKGMERICEKCSVGESQQEGAAAAASGPVDSCRWCEQKISENELSSSHFCKACRELRVKCQKCSTTTGQTVSKPLRAFSFERLLQWKKQRTLSSRALCLACDAHKTHPDTRYVWKEKEYECCVCQRRRTPQSFNPVELRSLEAGKQIYLAVCDDCKLRSSSEGQAQEERVKCKTCQRELPLAAFDAGTRRHHRGSGWSCWDCQHPVCSGAGCEVRQPIARVGDYTCPACLFPPCQVCKTTPRPQSTKYTCRNMPAWTCQTCAAKGAAKCTSCGASVSEYLGSRGGSSSELDQSLCPACLLYPPCQVCKRAPRPQSTKYTYRNMPTWTCKTCAPKGAA